MSRARPPCDLPLWTFFCEHLLMTLLQCVVASIVLLRPYWTPPTRPSDYWKDFLMTFILTLGISFFYGYVYHLGELEALGRCPPSLYDAALYKQVILLLTQVLILVVLHRMSNLGKWEWAALDRLLCFVFFIRIFFYPFGPDVWWFAYAWPIRAPMAIRVLNSILTWVCLIGG